MSHHRAFTPKTPRRFFSRCLPYTVVHKQARTKALKTAVKPILKSLRSLSLAAQIDVRPCFTFNSIGQKTAIRWRDAVGTAFSMPAHCADDSPSSLHLTAALFPLETRPTCLLSIRTDLQLGARGKGRSLELSAGPLTRNCHYLSRAGEHSPRNDCSPEAVFPHLSIPSPSLRSE